MQSPSGDYSYEDRLMWSDWAAFYEMRAFVFYRQLREALEKGGFDHAIIDTRTGFNISTIGVLRLLADSIYFVTPKNHQSLEGIKVVWDLVPQIGSPDEHPVPERILIVSRFRDIHAGEATAADDIIENIREGSLKIDFPHMDDVTDMERLLILNSDVSSWLYGQSASATATQNKFRSAFSSLCRKILSDKTFALKPLGPELRDDALIRKTTGFAAEGKGKLDQFLGRLKEFAAFPKGDSSGIPALPVPEQHVRANAGELDTFGLDLWLKKATQIQRAAIKSTFEKARRDFRKEHPAIDLMEYIPPTLEYYLGYALSRDSADSDPAGSLPADQESLPPLGPDPTDWDVTDKARKLRLKAVQLREGADAPVEALSQLNEAYDLLRTATARPGSDLYQELRWVIWELAVTRKNLSDWEGAFDLLSGACNDQPPPEAAGYDLDDLLLDIATEWMTQTGLPLEATRRQTADRIRQVLDLRCHEGSEEQRISRRIRMCDYDLAAKCIGAKSNFVEISAEISLSSQLRLDFLKINKKDDGANSYFERIDRIILCIRACALQATLMDEGKNRRRISKLFTEGEGLVAQMGRYAGNKADDDVAIATATLNLANIMDICGRSKEAYDLLLQALPLLNKRGGKSAGSLRDQIIVQIGLVADSLGRPDIGAETWADLGKADIGNVPRMSQWRRYRKGLAWWPAATWSSLGDVDKGIKELKKTLAIYRRKLRQVDLPPWDRHDSQEAVNGILPFLAFEMPRQSSLDAKAVSDYREHWLTKLRNDWHIRVDGRLRYALYCKSGAELALRMADPATALQSIEDGLHWNRHGASAFGDCFQTRQDLLNIMRAEILLLWLPVKGSRRTSEIERLDEICRGLEIRSAAMAADALSNGWHYFTLINISIHLAIAAAILAYADRPDLASERLDAADRCLVFVPRALPEWIKINAALPTALVDAAAGRLGNDERLTRAKAALPNLSAYEQSRYRRVFEACGAMPE